MPKLIYSMGMSLDGFIAGAGGDMSWLTEHIGPNPIVEPLIEQTGALLIGSRTFRGDDPNQGTESEGAFGSAWHGPQFVLTHHAPDTPVPGVTFVGDLDSAVASAKDAAGDKYVNVLGADVARQLLHAGLIDEVRLHVVPIVLGGGTPLFDGKPVELVAEGTPVTGKATHLRFRVAA